MSFKSAMAKVKFMFATQKAVDEQMQQSEEYLNQATNGAIEANIALGNKVTKCICVSVTPGYDIDHIIQEYAKVGINLKKFILKQGHRSQQVLYIPESEFSKLEVKQQKFFKRTTSNHKIYKQNLSYAVKKERA